MASLPPQVEIDGRFYTRGRNGRLYPRMFDWDLACDLYARGFSIDRLALRFGVTPTAILRVVDLDARKRIDERRVAWVTAGVCEECGATGCVSAAFREQQARSRPDIRTFDGRVLCSTCRGKTRRKKLRLDADGVLRLACGHCGELKPLDQFAPRVLRRLAAGQALRRSRCRSCDTAARRDYRERHKIPCDRCGQPCLPPSEKGHGRLDRALCLDCYRETELEQHRLAATSARRRRRAAV